MFSDVNSTSRTSNNRGKSRNIRSTLLWLPSFLPVSSEFCRSCSKAVEGRRASNCSAVTPSGSLPYETRSEAVASDWWNGPTHPANLRSRSLTSASRSNDLGRPSTDVPLDICREAGSQYIFVGSSISIFAVVSHWATRDARELRPLPASYTPTWSTAEGSGQGKEKRSFQTQPPSMTSRTAVWLRKDLTVTTAKAFRALRFWAPTTATRSWFGGSSSPSFLATFPEAKSRVKRATLNSPCAWSKAHRAWSTFSTSTRTHPKRVGSKPRCLRNAACRPGKGDQFSGILPRNQFARPSNRRWSTDSWTRTLRALTKSECAYPASVGCRSAKASTSAQTARRARASVGASSSTSSASFFRRSRSTSVLSIHIDSRSAPMDILMPGANRLM
mmetsp:Transcript_26760/g.81315  ORF Transcript_26760/g.81315 Transcript_26760/m.81315 type:complete len:388 (-) Transcript_26760:2400-3563(-)